MTNFEPPVMAGPPASLVYRSSSGLDYTQVDRVAIGDPTIELTSEARRERAICRALLQHALYLLGPEEGDW